MAISISSAVATSVADVLTAAVNGGSGAGTLKVYTGSKPATVATGVTGTLLATFTLEDPNAAGAVAGVSTWDMTPAISAVVAASGTAGYFRVADSAGVAVMDGTVGTSGADLNFSAVAWTSGGTVELTSGTHTMPLS